MVKSVEGVLKSPITSLTFAVGLALSGYTHNWVEVILTLLFLFSIALYVGLNIISLIEDLKWRNKTMNNSYYSKVEHDLSVNEKADLSGRYTYELVNSGSEEIRYVPDDNLYWFNEPESKRFSIEVLNGEGTERYIEKVDHRTWEVALDLFKDKARVISWDYTFQPPLKPGESIKYCVKIYAKRSEVDAFSDKGTYAGIPIKIPTKSASLTYRSPQNYKFDLIKPVLVVDQKGKPIAEENLGIPPPSLNSPKTLIEWGIESPKVDRRYWFKYKFKREDDV